MSAQTISWHYALNELYLCADCQRVSNSAITCLACGSQHGLLSLASALERPYDSDRLSGIAHAVELTSPTIDEMVGMFGFAACTDPDADADAELSAKPTP